MQEVRLKVYAKINLSLDIVGARENMHLLDSVMCSVSLYDEILAKKTNDGVVRVFANGDDFSRSNAYKTAIKMQQRYNLGSFTIEITQHIASGGGLGGSSADSAGVIRAIEKLFSLDIPEQELREIALTVGSDVPYMLNGGLCRLRGVGDDLAFYNYGGGEKVLLAGYGEVSTAKCFALYDECGSAVKANNDALINALISGKKLVECGEYFVNALQNPAVKINSAVAEILSVMSDNGLKCCMSGSGAYCFGVGEKIEWAKEQLQSRGIVCAVVTTMPCGIEME